MLSFEPWRIIPVALSPRNMWKPYLTSRLKLRKRCLLNLYS